MNPYYDEQGITIYHGDSREVLPSLKRFESCITDPVWPNAIPQLVGSEDPYGLFAETVKLIKCDRIAIQLGCDSDVRFLNAVPKRKKYLRTCWLDYAVPSYKGRILYTGDVAYVFGKPPPAKPGHHVLPGRFSSARPDKLFTRKSGTHRRNKSFTRRKNDQLPHPCARRYEHVFWLVRFFGGKTVIDPFGGSGTTALACKEQGKRCTLIEIEEKFCELAATRLCQGVLPFNFSGEGA